MYPLSLTQVFGEGAFQDATTITIQKASLLKLTATRSNTAESLIAAILITALSNFAGIITDENNQAITDENNQPITFDNSDAFELIKMIKWQPFQVNRAQEKYINNQLIISTYVKS